MNEDILNEGELSDLLRPLIEFGEKLGIPSNIWPERETLNDITFSSDEIRRENALTLSLKQTSYLIDSYGDAIQCKFQLNDLTILKITFDLDEEDLIKFKNKLGHSPIVKLDFKLDKVLLAKNLYGEAPGCNLFLYLSSKALERFLTIDLPMIESQLWGQKPSNRVIIQVSIHEIYLSGQYLAVIGGSYSRDWRTAIFSEPHDDKKLKFMYDICQDVLKWQTPWLKFLMPIHLKVDDQHFIDDPISRLIRIHLVNSIILYTADKTERRDNGHYVATYASSRQSIDIVLADPKEETKNAYSGIKCLFQMLEWAYNPL
jgi:hypothetical protein